jgi:hypothetical protein
MIRRRPKMNEDRIYYSELTENLRTSMRRLYDAGAPDRSVDRLLGLGCGVTRLWRSKLGLPVIAKFRAYSESWEFRNEELVRRLLRREG